MKPPTIHPTDIIVDNTILKDVLTCDTRTAVRHVLGLTTPGEAAELRVGSDLHEGLARWLVVGARTGDDEKARKSASERFQARYRPWSDAHVDKVDAKGKPSRLRWEPIQRIFDYWLEHKSVTKWGWVVKPENVEVALSAVLLEDNLWEDETRPRVVMVALLDALGKDRRGGGMWGIDHKTGRSLTEWWKDDQEDAAQFTGQKWLANENGLTISGTVINGIELPSLNSSNNTCRAHGVSYKNCALAHCRTEVMKITRTPHEVATWVTTAQAAAKRFLRLRARVKDVHDVRELKMQGRFNRGCSRCFLREWCRLGRPAHGLSNLVHLPWNPLEHAGKRGGQKDA